MKICSKCKNEKEECEFRLRKLNGGNTYFSWCKDCENKANKKRYIPTVKIPKTEPTFEMLEAKKLAAKKRMLLHRYGLEYQLYLDMYEKQFKKCAICNDERKLGGMGGLYVDHCHITKKVRGLLCPSCNSAIGKLKENESILIGAIKYLSDFK